MPSGQRQRRERNSPRIPSGLGLWQAFSSVRSVLPCDHALGLGGTLLFHLRDHPKTGSHARVRL
ncbi:hypothetical protein ACFC18_36555 [Streptomyces sp. NPDC056121]|uniref:hypothetical protein n=1 Tax=Streptomyces TaxID=1883 RepID=UPI001D0A01A5|nr:hypothetical protein [Streptomyces longhuiensis]UDL97348.1 hypothetical protein LGI35_03270 [Streptomyces longhuiensis]